MKFNDLISDMERFAKKENVPIMQKESLDYLISFIKQHDIKSVLEVGTAIGYSTILIKEVVNNITSIERDEERYKIASSNVNKSGLKNIELIFGDATDAIIEGKYDLLIIDAAKSQNMRFFNKYKNNLNENGIIIIDNLEFHGYVGRSNEIKSRNLRQMVRKIEKFLDFLDNNTEYDVEYIEVGDRLGICRKKNI